MQCPDCQAVNEDALRLCVACGRELPLLTASVYPPEASQSPTPVDLAERASEDMRARGESLGEHADEEEPYEINFTINPKKIKVEGHYHGIRYSAALESRDEKPLLGLLAEHIGRDKIKNFTEAAQVFAFALLERQFDFDLDKLQGLSKPQKSLPEKNATNSAKRVETHSRAPNVPYNVPPFIPSTPTQPYSDMQYVPTRKAKSALKNTVCTAVLLLLCYMAANIYKIYQNQKSALASDERGNAISMHTDVLKNKTDNIENYQETAYSINNEFLMPLPNGIENAIVRLRKQRSYSKEMLIDLGKALTKHYLKDKFDNYFKDNPDLLVNLFSDFRLLKDTTSIDDCIKGMTTLFNDRWDTANWSKTSGEAKKINIFEAIAAYGGDLGRYMIEKERAFRTPSQ